MSKNFIIIALALLFVTNGNSQTKCIQHWSHNKSQIVELDKIFASIKTDNLDTLYCDSLTMASHFNPTWYVNFYNKHFGKYFSNPRNVCFGMLRFRNKGDSITGEVHVTQFVLHPKQAALFKKRYGTVSVKTGRYPIEMLALYRYVVKGNLIYFVSTESLELSDNKTALFDQVCNLVKDD